MYAVGAVKRAVDDGYQHHAVIIDGAQIFIPPMENAISALGQSFGDTIILPPTAQDYSAEVARATSDADCVVGVISETPTSRGTPHGHNRGSPLSSTDPRATSTRCLQQVPKKRPMAT